MKVLNKVMKFSQNSGVINEVIGTGDHKFKITAELSNGRSKLTAEIMDKDGVFQFVLGGDDVDFEYVASYVSRQDVKKDDLEKGIAEMKKVIKKVYYTAI